MAAAVDERQAQSSVKDLLREEIVRAGWLAEGTKLAGFLQSFSSRLRNKWSNQDDWDSPLISSDLSLGSVEFIDLGEPVSPRILARAVQEILEDSENWQSLKSNPAFRATTQEAWRQAFEALTALRYDRSPSQAADHLDLALKALLSQDSTDQDQTTQAFPDVLKSELQNVRQAAHAAEGEWEKLSLAELGKTLESRIATLSVKKNAAGQNNVTWTDQDESLLKNLESVNKDWEDWQTTLREDRTEIVQDSLLEFSFVGKQRINNQAFQGVFLEHSPGFSPKEFAAVVAAATTYWLSLFNDDTTKTGPQYYFEISVLAAYRNFTQDLTAKKDSHQSGVTALQQKLELALEKTAADFTPSAAPVDAGGGDSASDDGSATTAQTKAETQTTDAPPSASTPTDLDRRTRQENRWRRLLERLANIERDLSSAATSEELTTWLGSVRSWAEDSLGVSGNLSTFSNIIGQISSLSVESWADDRDADEVDSILDTFAELLEAAAAFVSATPSDLTPGAAAKKAQEMAEERLAQTEPGADADSQSATDSTSKTSPADQLRAQLKDTTQLLHAQATLVGAATKMLEAELLQIPGMTPERLSEFFDENREQISHQLWTQYLAVINDKSTVTLDTATLARLAFGTSSFFLEKFRMESGLRGALGPADLTAAWNQELTPEIEEILRQVAQSYGYETIDDLWVDLFQTTDREAARQRFLDAAYQASVLNASSIEAHTRTLVSEFLGTQADNSLIERVLSTLGTDQTGLNAFLMSRPPDTLTDRQKQAWRELNQLLKTSETRPLTPEEERKFAALLVEVQPALQLYAGLRTQLSVLRQGVGQFQGFLSEASRFSTVEQRLTQGNAAYVPLIPVQFSQPGPILSLQQRIEKTEIQTVRRTGLSRHNLAIESALAFSLAQNGIANADFEAAYQSLIAAQLAEAGISQMSQDLASWQMRAHPPDRNGKAALNDLTSQIAGTGDMQSAAGSLAKTVSTVQRLKKIAIIGGGVVLGGAAGVVVLKALQATEWLWRPILNIAQFFSGGGSAVGSTIAGSGAAGAGSAVAKAAVSGGKEAASGLWINTSATVKSVASQTGAGITSFGSTVGGAYVAITTTAKTSAFIIAGGILAPLFTIFIMTFIVWAVIGNSLNDYGGLSLARSRRFGISGCWPTTGRITSMRTYQGGGPHAVSPRGTAIDIGAGSNENYPEIFSPFAGRVETFTGGFNDGYGTYVRVYNEQFDLIFAHMSLIEIPDGQTSVLAGEYLGLVGSTGRSSGNHLHYELIDSKNRGLEIFDVTPVGEIDMYYLKPVKPEDCGLASPSPTPALIIEPGTPGLIDPEDLLEGLTE